MADIHDHAIRKLGRIVSPDSIEGMQQSADAVRKMTVEQLFDVGNAVVVEFHERGRLSGSEALATMQILLKGALSKRNPDA